MTWQVVESTNPDIPLRTSGQGPSYAVSVKYNNAVDFANTIGEYGGHAGTALMLYVAYRDGSSLYSQYSLSQQTGNYDNTVAEAGRIAGGWSGAIAGGTLGGECGAAWGALGGPVGMAVGGLVGSLVGGGLGYYAGSSAMSPGNMSRSIVTIPQEYNGTTIMVPYEYGGARP